MEQPRETSSEKCRQQASQDKYRNKYNAEDGKVRFHEYLKLRAIKRIARTSPRRNNHDEFVRLPSISKTVNPAHHKISVLRFKMVSLGENSTMHQ